MKTFKTRNDLFLNFDKGLKIAEIGVFKGDFSDFIFNHLYPKELYLVDIFEGNLGSGDKDGNNMEYLNLDNSYKNLLEKYNKNENVKVIKDFSTRFLSKIDNNYFDIIYIDADHEYFSVKMDLDSAYSKIKIGGYLCGHDYTPKTWGVIKAVDEFCQANSKEILYLTEDGCPSYCIKI